MLVQCISNTCGNDTGIRDALNQHGNDNKDYTKDESLMSLPQVLEMYIAPAW